MKHFSYCSSSLRLVPIKPNSVIIRSVVKSAKSKKCKAFSDIPGPRGIFGIGSFYNYSQLFGKYSWDEMHISSMKKYEEYGPIVNERLYPGVNILHLFSPEDIATLLDDKNSMGYPQRRSHLALKKYRDDRPETYRSAGLLPTNGIEWWRLRSEFQKGLSSPKQVRSHLPDVDVITKCFVEMLSGNRAIDMLPELSRLNLESFDERLLSFSAEERKPNSRTSRLLEATNSSNSCILPTDQGLLWRFVDTESYRKLQKAQEYIEDLAFELVVKKLKDFDRHTSNVKKKDKNSILDEYFQNSTLQLPDVIGMAADLLLAGVETTTFSTCFALYHLAKHPKIQEVLYTESVRVLAQPNDPITPEILDSKIPYTRAVLKESLRLNPISIGVGRILNNNMVFSGYHVPKETVVVTQNMVACRLNTNFENPLKFLPDRWLKRDRKINPYLVLPFGHGMRACIARRLAEQNMLVILLRIIRLYSLKWEGNGELGVKTFLINNPDRSVNIKLNRRDWI